MCLSNSAAHIPEILEALRVARTGAVTVVKLLLLERVTGLLQTAAFEAQLPRENADEHQNSTNTFGCIVRISEA